MGYINKIINDIVVKKFNNNNSKFAEFMGTTESNIRNYRNNTEPKLQFVVNLSKKLEISCDVLLGSKQEQKISYDIVPYMISPATPDERNDSSTIPLVYPSAAAGFESTSFSISQEDVKEYYVVPKFKYCNIDFMIEISGSSMYPKYNSGDIIACSVLRSSEFIQWNKCHLIATREQGLLVKRLRRSQTPNCLLAVSDNPNYDPFDIPEDEILGIALIVGVIRLE